MSQAVEDPYVLRAHRSVPMDTWLRMERELCRCEDVCTRDWDAMEEGSS